MQTLAQISPKPIRLVINTHWHFDYTRRQSGPWWRQCRSRFTSKARTLTSSASTPHTSCDRVITMAQPATRIIPGHGPLSDGIKVKSFRDMLATIRERVRKQVTDHRALADAQAAKVTADYDATWGNFFITGAQLIETLYIELTHPPGH